MDDQHRLYTAGEVQRLVGITQRRVAYWDKSGLVRPHGRIARGPGTRRLYTTLDVVRLKIIRRLLEAGMSLQKIRRALDFADKLPDEPAPLAELELIADGQGILVRRSDEGMVDALTGQYLLRLPLADLLAEVRDGVTPPLLAEDSTAKRTVAVGGHRA